MSEQANQQQKYRVLVSVELDATADTALEEGFRMTAANPAAELHLVHVVSAEGLGAAEQLVQAERRITESTQDIRRYVERQVASHQVNGPILIHVRVGNDPAFAILQSAVDLEADLIIVGTHRRKGLEKLLLGSVAERILREAHCPVMVALRKDYANTNRTLGVEPPCPDCLAVRAKTNGAQFWCERHSRSYSPPHVYVPSDRGRDSLMPST